MKEQQSKHTQKNTESTTKTEKRAYTKPEIVSESLFESAALGAGKTIDDFPVLCSEVSDS